MQKRNAVSGALPLTPLAFLKKSEAKNFSGCAVEKNKKIAQSTERFF